MAVDGGTLRIADGNTLSLGGDYSQTVDGILQIGASSSASYGQLNVAGTADFAADSKIDIDVATVNTLANGNLLDSVISAGTLNASTFNVTDNSALFDFAAVVNNDNTVDLTTQQTRTVSTSVRNRRATQNYGAASVLDSFMSGGTSGSDMDNVVTAFGRLATDEEVSEAVAETLPLMQGATTQAAANVMQTTGRIIRTRQAMTSGLASGDGFIADKHGWVKPIGSWATQHSIDDSAGFTVDSYGIIGGVDGDISDNDTVGIALSYVDSSMKGENSTSRNSADIDAYQIAFYGQHDLGAEAYDLSVNWQADWGINKTEGKRHMSFIGRTAESDYDTYTTHVGVGVGRTFAVAERTTLTPSVQLDYSHIENRRYTETGAGALNLSVSDDQIDAFVVSLQGDLMHEFNDQWALLANAGVGYDLIDDDTSVTSTYAGGGTAFTTQGLNQAPWRVTAGVGVNYNLDDTTTLSANYDMQGKENFLSHTASAKVRWMF
ncbi:autotransporter outer membrane beta-barrel domain-containing protein [Marinomonas ostreistagni]|uniref:autotransporter outer membrane beta-barrel domain-containing protein n=1 Tax=Marinomonas ostreistagni TaxID=359209 RepID=UPI001EF30C28|nr:autotransporter outer membrane beta-barrel domain-containing protein [Marinomonas ostreistagni]